MTHRAALLSLLVLCTPALRAQVVDLPGLPSITFLSLAAREDTLLAGSMEEVYASFDGGTTWKALTPPKPDARGVDALMLTDAGWFASVYAQGVYHSADRGRTWRAWSTGLTGLGATYVTGLAERSGWLYAATEGGVFRLHLHPLGTWQRYGTAFAENAAETVAALLLHDDRLIAAAGGNGLVFLEDPERQDWTPVFVGGHLLDLTVTGGAVVATARNRSFFSLDEGRTWQPTGPGLPSAVSATLATAGAYTYAAHTVGVGVSRLYRSSDLAAPWEPVANVSETLRMLVHGTRLYLAQSDGLRAYSLVPVSKAPDEQPAAGVQLGVPSPNPVGEATRISFRLERPASIHLAAYDLLGRQVALLFDGIAPAEQTTLTWKTDGLAAGVYTIRLVTSCTVLTQPLVAAH